MHRALQCVALAGVLALVGSGVSLRGLNAVSAATQAIPCYPSALIAAVEAANVTPGPDAIALAPGCVYSFTVPYSSALTDEGYWYGPSALPAIASDITIVGNGATIARDAPATAPFRLFFVGADPTSPDTFGYATPGAGVLTLSDVTLKGGLAVGGSSNGGGGAGGLGGAIFSQGRVQLLRVTLLRNVARGGAGGAATQGSGGGGVGADATDASGDGAGFGFAFGFGSSGGVATNSGGGGGGGFRISENGASGIFTSGGSGGGPATGLAGSGGGSTGGGSGNGSGGGARADRPSWAVRAAASAVAVDSA